MMECAHLDEIRDLWHHADRGRETAEQRWRPILRRFDAANASIGGWVPELHRRSSPFSEMVRADDPQ